MILIYRRRKGEKLSQPKHGCLNIIVDMCCFLYKCLQSVLYELLTFVDFCVFLGFLAFG